MNITELLFCLGGVAIGSAVGVLMQARKRSTLPSAIAAPAWAKTTDPIPVVASNSGKPHSNCIFCDSAWKSVNGVMTLVVWLDPGGRVYHVAGCPTLAEKAPVVPYDGRRDHWRNPCRCCKPDVHGPP